MNTVVNGIYCRSTSYRSLKSAKRSRRCVRAPDDVFQYGEIEEMNVCDNLGDHLVGNVYVKVSVISGLPLTSCDTLLDAVLTSLTN